MWFSSQSCLEEQERGWDTAVHSVETDSRYRVLMQISLAVIFLAGMARREDGSSFKGERDEK